MFLREIYLSDGPVGFVILTNKPDTVVAARGRDVVEVYWPKPYDNATEATLSVPPKLLTTVDEDKPENRLNDAKADVAGRLWAGDLVITIRVNNYDLL